MKKIIETIATVLFAIMTVLGSLGLSALMAATAVWVASLLFRLVGIVIADDVQNIFAIVTTIALMINFWLPLVITKKNKKK